MFNQNALRDSLIGEVQGIRCNKGKFIDLDLKSEKGKPSGTLTLTFDWQQEDGGSASNGLPVAQAAVAVGSIGGRILKASMDGGSGQVTVSGSEQNAASRVARARSTSGSAQFVTSDKQNSTPNAAAVLAPAGNAQNDVPVLSPSVPVVEEADQDGSAMFVTDHVKTVDPARLEAERKRKAAEAEKARLEEERRAKEAAEAAAAAAAAERAAAAAEAQRVAQLQEQQRQAAAQAAAQKAEYERQRAAQAAAAAERQRQAALAAQQQAERQRQAQLQALQAAQQASQARAASGMVLVEVQVPAGIGPGQALQIRAPSGQLLQVTVPAGVYAGMKFKAQVPAASPAPVAPSVPALPGSAPGAVGSSIYNQFQYPGASMLSNFSRGHSMMGAGMPQPRISPAPVRQRQVMMVTVPNGVYAGQNLQLRTPNGQLVQVQVPQGCGPGSQFQIQV